MQCIFMFSYVQLRQKKMITCSIGCLMYDGILPKKHEYLWTSRRAYTAAHKPVQLHVTEPYGLYAMQYRLRVHSSVVCMRPEKRKCKFCIYFQFLPNLRWGVCMFCFLSLSVKYSICFFFFLFSILSGT